MHHTASKVALLPKPSAVAVGKLKKPCVIDGVSLPHQNWLAFDDILCQGLGNGETDNAEIRRSQTAGSALCGRFLLVQGFTLRGPTTGRALCVLNKRV